MVVAVEVNQLILLAVAGLLLGVSAFLGFAPGSSRERRLLACALFLTGAGNLLLVFGSWDDTRLRSDPYYALTLDVTFVAHILLAALFLRWPVRSDPRSFEGVLGLAGLAVSVALAIAWIFARPLLFEPAPDGYPYGTRNIWYMLVHNEGRLYTGVLVCASLALRARRAPQPERTAANLAAVGIYANNFFYAGTVIAWSGYLVATGDFGGYAPLREIPGDPIDFYLWYHVVAGYIAAPLLTLFWALRERFWWPVGIAAVGGALAFPSAWSGTDLFFIPLLLSAALPAYAVARLRAFGSPATPARAQVALATGTALAFFVGIVAVAFGIGATNPLHVTVAAGIALVVSGAAGAALLPGARVLLADVDPATPTRSVPGAAKRPDTLLLKRYRVLRPLGEGGAGTTLLCRDERVGRDVVVKTLRGNDAAGDRVEAILREARAIGAIRHPNVVTLFDVTEHEGEAVLVMEHAEKGSLRDRLAQGPLGREELARLGRGLLSALDAVHAAGIVHRDVKPSNVLLDAHGEPKLADFGIARMPGLETTVGALRGVAVGTYRYMSPEQARGRPATARSDLFAAGATLYEAHMGQPYMHAEPGETAAEVQLRAASLGPFRRTIGDARLGAFFARALDPDPARRFADAREMRAAFSEALPGAA